MRAGLRGAFAGALAVGITVAVGALSQVPFTAASTRSAVVRLAWRARGQRVEECRRLTPEELERLPAHMRRAEECEGRILPSRLEVTLDGATALAELVHAAGAREDRPLYVFRELPVPPGEHRLAVTFARQGEPVGREAEEVVTPARLTLDTTLTLSQRQVALVTYDDVRRRLVVRLGAVGADRRE